jgi:cell division protein FtsB
MATRQRTRKVAVALPSMESAPENWLRNIRLSGFAFLVLSVIVLGIVVLAPGLRTYFEQRQQIAALEAQVTAAQTEVDDLTGEVARWSDPAYIEAQARERIYYVYPGEFSYLVIGAPADDETATTTANGAPISDQIQTTQVNWVQSLMSSVVTAGLTDATPSELSESTSK